MPPLEHQAQTEAAHAASPPDPTPPLHVPTPASGRSEPESIRRAATPPLTAGQGESAAARRAPVFRTTGRVEARTASGGSSNRGAVTAGLALRIERRRNPRLLGALAYAMPLLPALALLLRERRNRFVRAHAAQALIFFAGLALAQIALYALLVLAGGLTTSLRAATVLAATFALTWLVLAALGFIAWTRLVAAALAGHVASLPLVTPLARRLLRGFDRIAGPRQRARNDRQNAAKGAPRRMTFS